MDTLSHRERTKIFCVYFALLPILKKFGQSFFGTSVVEFSINVVKSQRENKQKHGIKWKGKDAKLMFSLSAPVSLSVPLNHVSFSCHHEKNRENFLLYSKGNEKRILCFREPDILFLWDAVADQ